MNMLILWSSNQISKINQVVFDALKCNGYVPELLGLVGKFINNHIGKDAGELDSFKQNRC